MKQVIGSLYTIPSGCGGTLTVRVLGFLPGGALLYPLLKDPPVALPERVSLRVEMPKNHDWHGWLIEANKNWFYQAACAIADEANTA